MMTKKEMQEFVTSMKSKMITEKRKERDETINEIIKNVEGYKELSDAIELSAKLAESVMQKLFKQLKNTGKPSYPRLEKTLKNIDNELMDYVMNDFSFFSTSETEEKEFNAILGNLKGMTPTKAETYLQSLGFVLPEISVKKNEIMAPVNIKSIQQYIVK